MGVLVLVGIVLLVAGGTYSWQNPDIRILAGLVSLSAVGIMAMIFYAIPLEKENKE